MTGPGDGPPRPVIPLDYGGRSGEGVWPAARFVATFVVVQGAAVLASSGWSAARLGLEAADPSDRVAAVVEGVKAAAGAGLVVGGVLARRRRGGGPPCCVACEAGVGVLFVAETAVWLWQLGGNGYAGREAVLWGGDYALQLLVELAMPAFGLAFFRRPDVRAAVQR